MGSHRTELAATICRLAHAHRDWDMWVIAAVAGASVSYTGNTLRAAGIEVPRRPYTKRGPRNKKPKIVIKNGKATVEDCP